MTKRAIRRRLLRANGKQCAYCGVRLTMPRHGQPRRHDAMTIDHVHPVSRGGSEDINNKILACNACNLAKGNMPVEEFLALRARGVA